MKYNSFLLEKYDIQFVHAKIDLFCVYKFKIWRRNSNCGGWGVTYSQAYYHYEKQHFIRIIKKGELEHSAYVFERWMSYYENTCMY